MKVVALQTEVVRHSLRPDRERKGYNFTHWAARGKKQRGDGLIQIQEGLCPYVDCLTCLIYETEPGPPVEAPLFPTVFATVVLDSRPTSAALPAALAREVWL